MLRVGIIGIGFMGMVHYVTYQKLRGVSVTAICERDARRRAGDWRDIRGNFGPPGARMDLNGVRVYGAIDDLLADPEIDAVDITLPPALHADTAIAAMRAGKDVFTEKPIAMTASDCRRMTRAAEATDRRLLVGHVLPFFPEYAWALKTIRGQKFGRLLGGSFKRVIADPTWLKRYWSASHVGGPMLDLHVHDAHFIRLLFGMPDAVITQGRTRGELAEHWTTQFCYNDRRYAVSATGGVVRQPGRSFNHAFELHLEDATLAFEFAVTGDDAGYYCKPTLFDNKGAAREVKLPGGDPMDAFADELREVTRCLRSGDDNEILSSALACDAIRLCDAQTRSLLTNRKTAVSSSRA